MSSEKNQEIESEKERMRKREWERERQNGQWHARKSRRQTDVFWHDCTTLA